MKHLLFLISGLLFSVLSFGQAIQLQTGASFSEIDWRYKDAYFDLGYNKMLISPSVLIGINYLNFKHVNLSTNLGYVCKGGKVDNSKTPTGIYRDPGSPLQSKLHYLSVNTTIDIKFPVNRELTPFVCFGPRIDYLLKSEGEINSIKKIGALKNTMQGVVVGGGIRYKMKKEQIGLRFDYYLNNEKVAEWLTSRGSFFGGEIEDHTFTINLTYAYDVSRNPWKKAMKSICKKQWR